MNTILQGIQHITDLEGYDHMLFILALCAPYLAKDWKKLVWMATAFTIGHSITLALSALDVIRFSGDLIELLIPITIMATATWNIAAIRLKVNGKEVFRYMLIIGFGLIHGMGFSSYFRMMFNETPEMIKNLLLFNIGVEMGQIIIIAVILSLIYLLHRFAKLKANTINVIFSSFAFIVAAWLVWGKLSE